MSHLYQNHTRANILTGNGEIQKQDSEFFLKESHNWSTADDKSLQSKYNIFMNLYKVKLSKITSLTPTLAVKPSYRLQFKNFSVCFRKD